MKNLGTAVAQQHLSTLDFAGQGISISAQPTRARAGTVQAVGHIAWLKDADASHQAESVIGTLQAPAVVVAPLATRDHLFALQKGFWRHGMR